MHVPFQLDFKVLVEKKEIMLLSGMPFWGNELTWKICTLTGAVRIADGDCIIEEHFYFEHDCYNFPSLLLISHHDWTGVFTVSTF